MKAKISILIALAMMLVLVNIASAQVDVYGVAGAGSLMKDGASKFAATVGANTNIKSDSASGFRTYSQTMMKYSDGFGQSEIQEMSQYIMQEKTLGLWQFYAALGTGAIVDIQSGQDNFDLALKAELGAELGWKLGLAVGVEYIPLTGEPDRTFVYGTVDLFR